MLILFSCFFLFVTAFSLILLRAVLPNMRYTWLVSVGGATLALAGVLLWQSQMPFSLLLPDWQPRTIFISSIIFRADQLSWPLALSISALTLSVLLTAVVRSTVTNSTSWAVTLALGGLGLLAVTANNPLSLLLVWSALDLTEFLTELRSADDPLNNGKFILSFTSRTLGSFLLLWVIIVSISTGSEFDFQSISPTSGLYLVVAAGIRLGVLPFYLPYSSEFILRRGFSTAIRLISAASSLALLAHIPQGSLNSVFTPYLIILAIIAALYGSWMWLRAPDEMIGRQYWIIALAALSVISALNGNSLGAVAWGCALVIVGGALFLASVQHSWLKYALLLGAWSLSSLPFSLTAVVGIGAFGFSTPFVIIAQSLLISGFIRLSFRTGNRDSIDSQEKWVKRVYPFGILLLLMIQLLLGWAGWVGARQVGAWAPAVSVTFITIILVWVTPRFRVLNPIRTEWEKSNGLAVTASNDFFRVMYNSYERISQAITNTIEGEGGIMWTLLFLILLILLLTHGLS